MAQADQIDQTLEELRQAMGNTLTMINIVVALRRNSGHLLQLLRSMMDDLCEQIDRALPTFPDEEEQP
jgi:ABC-type transporter Mla subunit MlaD